MAKADLVLQKKRKEKRGKKKSARVVCGEDERTNLLCGLGCSAIGIVACEDARRDKGALALAGGCRAPHRKAAQNGEKTRGTSRSRRPKWRRRRKSNPFLPHHSSSSEVCTRRSRCRLAPHQRCNRSRVSLWKRPRATRAVAKLALAADFFPFPPFSNFGALSFLFLARTHHLFPLLLALSQAAAFVPTRPPVRLPWTLHCPPRASNALSC